jgi:hypothetical protein
MSLAAKVLSRFKRAGGTDFSVFIQNPDAKAAFNRAVDDAQHESGHGGYSGTIAEKSGFTIRKHEPMTMDEAHRFVDTDIEKNEKWGPAYAIPIAEAAKSSEKKFKVKVPGKEEWAVHGEAEKVVREKFAPQLQGGVSAVIKVEKTTKIKEGKLPEMTLAKGGPEGFKVVGPGGRVHQQGWDAGKIFPSRAEALTALKELVLSVKPQTGAKYDIVKFKTTDSFTIGDTTKSMHLFEVEGTVTFQKTTGKIIGWLFYGIASS